MATVTKGKTFISGETVEPADMHQLVDSATVTNIVDADIDAAAAIAASKLASTLDLSSKTVTLPNASVAQANLAANVVGNGPAFYAYASGNTSVPNNSSTKVTLAGERFDTASCFASSTFTPNVAGYYQLNASVFLGSVGAAFLSAEIRKNGSLGDGLSGVQDNGSDTRISQVGGLIYFNGTTDYAELFCYQASGSSKTVNAAQNGTYFSGFLARAA